MSVPTQPVSQPLGESPSGTSPDTGRKPYHKPELVKYGSLGELTQRGSGRWSEWIFGPRQWDWLDSAEAKGGVPENGQPF